MQNNRVSNKKEDFNKVRKTTQRILKYYDKLIETIDLLQSNLQIEKNLQGEYINSAILLNSVNLLTVYVGNHLHGVINSLSVYIK